MTASSPVLDLETDDQEEASQQEPQPSTSAENDYVEAPNDDETIDLEAAAEQAEISSDEEVVHDTGPLTNKSKISKPKLPGQKGSSIWMEPREVEPDEMLRYCDQLLEWLSSQENTTDEEIATMPAAEFRMWDKFITETSRGEVEGKKEYIQPGWMKKEFFRYLKKTKGKSSSMPTYACLDLLETALTSPIVCEMYPDFPENQIQGPREMYVAAQYEKMKRKYPHLNFPQIQKALFKKYSESVVVKLRYLEDFRRLLDVRRRLYGEFFDKHPELKPSFRIWWDKQIERQLEQIASAEKRMQAKLTFTPRTAFDLYREAKAKKYSHLTGDDLEAKLHRHFDKMSTERKAAYEQQAQQWLLKNCPDNWRGHYGLAPKRKKKRPAGAPTEQMEMERRRAKKSRIAAGIDKATDENRT